MTTTEPLTDQEKVLVQRHLREGEEVIAVYRKVKYSLAEERTVGNVLLDSLLLQRSKAKAKGKIPILVETAINGNAARIIFLNKKYDALKLKVVYAQSVRNLNPNNPSNATPERQTEIRSAGLPHSIVLSPELIYKVTNEFVSKSEESFEKGANKEIRKEFSRGQAKLARKQAKEERKHPSASNLDSWFEIKAAGVDKKLLRKEYVSMILIAESAKRRAKMNIISLEQIKESMGNAAKGSGSAPSFGMSGIGAGIARPFRLNLFMKELTDNFHAFVKEALLS
jgi:hypothetical protein